MNEMKILLIAGAGVLYGAFVIGTERAIPFLIMFLIAGVIWLFLSQKKKYDLTKFEHLSGNYKIKITCLSNLGNVYAEGKYKGYGDGSFDLDKLYAEGNDEDIRQDISQSEWSSVRDEIGNYFRELQK